MASRLEDAVGERLGGTSLGAWLLGQLLQDRVRWPLWLPVAFALGIGGYFWLPWEPALWAGPVAFFVTGLLAFGYRSRPAALIFLLIAVAVAAGFTASQTRTAAVAAPVLAKRTAPMTLVGEVLRIEPREKGQRILLRPVKLPELAPGSWPARVRVKLARAQDDIRPGDLIQARVILQPPPGPAEPGAYDFSRRAYFERLGAVGFILGKATARDPPTDAVSQGGWLAAWQQAWTVARIQISGRIWAVLPDERGAVAAALMTGERGRIPAEVLQAMRDSGLAHLLAISGLHMGLVAGLLFFAVRDLLALVPRVALYYPIKKWAAVAAGLGAFAYLFLAGATVPTQRAFLMAAVVLLAVLLDRRAVSMRLVAWAAFVVLLLAPESLLSASFQMSFAAVTGLVAFYELLRNRQEFWQRRSLLQRIGLYLLAVLMTSVIANLATAPFAAFHFNRLVLFGLAANLVAVPITALWIMPWAILAFVLMPFGAEAIALVPMSWGIGWVLAAARTVADWEGSVQILPALPPVALLSVTLGGLWLCLWRARWRLFGLAPILLGLASLFLVVPPDIWISGDGKLIGLRGDKGGLWLSTTRAKRFQAETWQRRAGLAEGRIWPRDAGSEALSCDSLGCLYRSGEHLVTLVEDPRALDEDCYRVTLMISKVPLRGRPCPTPQVVIDRFDLWREGAHTIWLSETTKIDVRSVGRWQGARPWSTWRRPE